MAGILLLGAPPPPIPIVMNVILAPINLAKGFGFALDPDNSSADGYPVTTPSSAISANPSMPTGYYDNFVWKFSGQGSMQMLSTSVVVVSGGTNVVEVGTAAGDASGNITILSKTNPRVVLAFGWSIQAISDNGSGLIQVTTKTGYLNNGGSTGQLIKITNANANTGANGTWTITKIDAQNFYLQGSIFTNAQASPAGTAIYIAGNLSIRLHNAGTFSGMSNLVWCKEADETLVDAGKLVDPVYTAQLQYLKPAWLRMMDISAVQASYECDFAQRMPVTNINYAASRYVPAYWAGAVTNGGSDAYTCSNPSASGGGAYANNEIVQGTINATNTGGNPTLNVNSRGAKPIFNFVIEPLRIDISAAAASAGLVMEWTFTATWLNSGTPFVFQYTTVAGDMVSVAALKANLVIALSANATLSASKIVFVNSGSLTIYYRTPLAGALTVAYSSGPAICTMIRITPSSFTAAGRATFIYSALLGGWIYRSGGMLQTVPFEYMVELCNDVSANCWLTWPIETHGQYITDVTDFFADAVNGLSTNLKFGTEVGNEMWNFGQSPWGRAVAKGHSLGFTAGSNNPNYSFVAARVKQYGDLAITAWTGAGRARSNLYLFNMSATWDLANADTAQFKGSNLSTATNTIYGSYGGLDATAASTYTTSPNRPIDICDALGVAPYWGSPWLAGEATSLTGTVVQNAPLLQAALDYANGSFTAAYDAMYGQLYGTITRSGGSAGGITFTSYKNSTYAQLEAICLTFDPGRSKKIAVIHYEGGPQFGFNLVNGTNDATTNIPAVAARITSLGWDVSAYTVSTTNDATEMATQLVGLVYNFKFSTQFKNLYKQGYADVVLAHAGREASGAQYGYTASQWGLFPRDFGGINYSSYEAIHEFNNGI